MSEYGEMMIAPIAADGSGRTRSSRLEAHPMAYLITVTITELHLTELHAHDDACAACA